VDEPGGHNVEIGYVEVIFQSLQRSSAELERNGRVLGHDVPVFGKAAALLEAPT
jgi:hypothetical protein